MREKLPLRFNGALAANRNKEALPENGRRLSFLSSQACEGLACAEPGEVLGLLTLRLGDSYSLIGSLGEEVSFRILESVLDLAREAFSVFFSQAALLREEQVGFGEYALLFSAPRALSDSLFQNYVALRFSLLAQAESRIFAQTEHPVSLTVGYALLPEDPGASPDLLAFRAFCQGQALARAKLDPHWLTMREELAAIVAEGRIDMVFQPVVDFRLGTVLGWEALARGPRGSLLHAPTHLFSFAEETGLAQAADRLCREKAIRLARDLSPEHKLFVNVQPSSLRGETLTPESLSGIILAAGLSPSNLVLEFPEKGILTDINLFLKKIEPFRGMGLLLAIDDVGSANSTLRALSLVRPDFIKVDVSLVSTVESNPFKRMMMESLLLLSEKLGCRLIAEGVETDTEFSSLVSMGVHAGQGFFFGQPAPGREVPEVRLPARVGVDDVQDNVWNCSIPMRKLVQPAFAVDTELTIQGVKDLLKDKPPLSSVVVVQDQKPLGLIMNYNLDRHLSTMYGISLYYNRDVTKLMDPDPLIADADQSVEDVAKKAMNRESGKIYDDIIVAENGRLTGIVSVQKMLDTLAKVHMELAKGSNPLTGLPGNVSIEMEISLRAKNRTASSLIYVDLDNFKVYNDVYGFTNGDRIILATARILREAVAARAPGDGFVGHVGGDDFVVIAPPEAAEDLCRLAVEGFEREIPALYNEQDRLNGYITGTGRDGVQARFPLVSASLGVVDCAFRHPFTHAEMSRRTAEMKKLAKSRAGNSWVRDRRAPLGSAPSTNGEGEKPEPAKLALVHGAAG
jgi:diguanylate cyclase (GGDEF)-like protein